MHNKNLCELLIYSFCLDAKRNKKSKQFIRKLQAPFANTFMLKELSKLQFSILEIVIKINRCSLFLKIVASDCVGIRTNLYLFL